MHVLETERLILRRFIPADLEVFYAHLSRPEVVRFEPYPPLRREEAAEALRARIDSPEMIAIERKDTHRLIGNVYLGRRDCESAELGYVLHSDHWHQGYAREACEAIIRDAFAGGVHRIYAECDPPNEASWRLL